MTNSLNHVPFSAKAHLHQEAVKHVDLNQHAHQVQATDLVVSEDASLILRQGSTIQIRQVITASN